MLIDPLMFFLRNADDKILKTCIKYMTCRRHVFVFEAFTPQIVSNCLDIMQLLPKLEAKSMGMSLSLTAQLKDKKNLGAILHNIFHYKKQELSAFSLTLWFPRKNILLLPLFFNLSDQVWENFFEYFITRRSKFLQIFSWV